MEVIEPNIRIEDDSDTDYDDDSECESSDDDISSKFGRVTTGTSSQGKVRVKHDEDDDLNPSKQEDMDDFEIEMERELAQNVYDAEKNANICGPLSLELQDKPSGTDKKSEESQKEKYSDIYFDSDEEEGDERKVVSDADLFYDPEQDQQDQDWVDSVRQSYQMPGSSSNTAGIHKLLSSDAVLNCPACFTVLCLDCQRHEVYHTQYRAMFVVNCTVNTAAKMKFPVKVKKGKRGAGQRMDPDEWFHPVACDTCKTEVAMYDKDEVYHFFNVVASHS